ncbi:MAG TPA: histidine--tRNA ligase [Bdellovibrionota bacterium]|jgi:histidyl-tRNA synthetase
MSKVSSNPPSGFRDFLPDEAAARLSLVDTITKVYRSHGFQPIGMPLLENLSTLQGKGGGTDNEKLIFKVMKRGEELQRAIESKAEFADMGLRFDLTLPLARYCARFREQLPKPFKVFQIGPVWRADRPQKGRFREFFQCDVDIVGAKEIGAEVDCIAAMLEAFEAVGMDGVEVHLNDRKLLSALGKCLKLDDAVWAKCLVALDKLDKMPPEKVYAEIDELAQEKPGAVTKKLQDLFSEGAKSKEWESLDQESFASVQNIVALLKASGTEAKVVFNPTLVRGQDYYTGTIFEFRHANLSGSLGGGGRYNRLLEVFGSPETPAFGGSIGFERLFMLLEEKKATSQKNGAAPQVFFPLLDEALRGQVFGIAADWRKSGLCVDVYPDAAKLKNQFKYADDRKIPYTAILGADEAKAGQIKLKDMAKGEEKAYPTQSAKAFLVNKFTEEK